MIIKRDDLQMSLEDRGLAAVGGSDCNREDERGKQNLTDHCTLPTQKVNGRAIGVALPSVLGNFFEFKAV